MVLGPVDFVMSKIAPYGQFVAMLRKLIDYFFHLSENLNFYCTIVANDKEFTDSVYLSKIEWPRNENDQLYIPSYADITRVAFMKEFERGKVTEPANLLSGRNFETRSIEKDIEESHSKSLNMEF
ncbi:hypothetical protein [Corynebacterium sp. CCM 9203]|uniref:hypothetical protein n=1 Tax=Corynebacterium sp. CCM 9203 TaxID=3057615 RepID=UPI0035242C78